MQAQGIIPQCVSQKTYDACEEPRHGTRDFACGKNGRGRFTSAWPFNFYREKSKK